MQKGMDRYKCNERHGWLILSTYLETDLKQEWAEWWLHRPIDPKPQPSTSRQMQSEDVWQ